MSRLCHDTFKSAIRDRYARDILPLQRDARLARLPIHRGSLIPGGLLLITLAMTRKSGLTSWLYPRKWDCVP